MKKAIERKQNTEDILRQLGLPVPHDIPPLEEENAITLRTAREVAERSVILTYVNCAAVEPELRERIMQFLIEEGLWEQVSPQEKEWLAKETLTDHDITDMLWRGESNWLLLWAINKVDQLQLPVREVDLPELFKRIPAIFESPADFVSTATLRSKSEILDQCDFIFRVVWVMKQAKSAAMNEMTLNESVAFERHFAVNWVAGIAADWDRK